MKKKKVGKKKASKCIKNVKKGSGGSVAPARRKAAVTKPKFVGFRRLLWFWIWRFALLGWVLFVGFVAYTDIAIRHKFEGQKWALPAHVYTRPMELYIGQKIDLTLVEQELQELGYRRRSDTQRVGSYTLSDNTIQIHQREFRFWDSLQPKQHVNIETIAGVISRITLYSNEELISAVPVRETEIVRLEPRLFGSVSPLSHEDRSLLKLEDVPPQLINALIAIEDRQFYSHFGVNPLGILRAMVRNISAGKVVQGGSTLTQQLVKNYYLNSDRTVKRKLIEMVMAVLLEAHYSKQEILQAYLNEVYLSQAGNRAIHGFALGSQTFFGRPLQELDLPELATLAGIIKGPSFYNPLKYPERARQRRNLVLQTMLEESFIDQDQFDRVSETPMRVNRSVDQAATLAYPAYLGFLRQGLRDQYQEQDILTDGLAIHTTLNPRIQQALENAVRRELDDIEAARKISAGELQAAAVVIRTDNGEVAAMVGDRKAQFSGYNRALHAKRPVGSLLKPFVYLTALEQPQQYSLATRIDDRSITVSQSGSMDWRPQNYNNREHGPTMLVDALAYSYNLATVRLGMEVGVANVIKTLQRVGYNNEIQPLPSVLLGAVPMTVLDVAQLYMSIASGGFNSQIKGIRAVLSSDNQPLARYPLSIDQVIEPQHNSVLTFALQEVVRYGTARAVGHRLDRHFALAGKTGTTNDYRDSWFAGFSGNYLTVVWVGRDDNQPTGLTGASGAARIWSRAMQTMSLQPVELPFDEDVVSKTVYYSRDPYRQDCTLSRQLPVLLESLPLDRLPCAEYMQADPDDETRFFEPNDSTQRKTKKRRKSFWERLFG